MYVPMRTAFIPNMYVNHAADAMATSKIADASAHTHLLGDCTIHPSTAVTTTTVPLAVAIRRPCHSRISCRSEWYSASATTEAYGPGTTRGSGARRAPGASGLAAVRRRHHSDRGARASSHDRDRAADL